LKEHCFCPGPHAPPQLPPLQVVLALQATPFTHAPLEHVCGVLPLHCFWVGPQEPPQVLPTHVVLTPQEFVDDS
jgi:hypothetical protein